MYRFFDAKRVAVIGVSPREGNLGQRIIRNLLNYEFEGEFFPVGPRGGAYQGIEIYKSVLDIPGKLDLAAILIPAEAIPAAMEECGQKGIERIVIESGGFAEFSERGEELTEQVLDVALKYNMRIIGPNGIGITNRHTGLALPFTTLPKPEKGHTALISQSGGVGIKICSDFVDENIGLSKFASMGNKIDVNEADLIDYLAADDKTKTIIGYLESFGNGREFFDAARRCSKPIVALKSNIGETSHRIAASHTSAIMTDDKVVDAMFRQAGVIRARNHYHLTSAAKIFSMPPMKGDRLAVLSRSGGHAVIASDYCHLFNFKLPELDKNLLEEVTKHLRAGVVKLQNPMDLGDLMDMEVYQVMFDKVIGQKNIDGALILFAYFSAYDPQVPLRIVDSLYKSMNKHNKPVALVVNSFAREVQRIKEYSPLPIYDTPEEAVWALSQSRFHYNRHHRSSANPSRPEGIREKSAQAIIKTSMDSGIKVLNAKAFDVLDRYGLPCPKRTLVNTPDEAVEAAKSFEGPVALKVEGEKLTHKTDIRGVRLGLRAGWEIRAAVSEWQARLGDSLEGVLVQLVAPEGPELILGGKQDEQFGPTVLLGWGGVMAELMENPVMRLAPISEFEANEMIDELPGRAVIEGYRGEEPISRAALIDALVRLSWLLADNPQVAEIDLNPLRAYPNKALVLDARVILQNSK